MARRSSRIVIIGAGPTGLGAAWRLQELGHGDWVLLERESGPGGLSASVRDAHGFTWDLGGHVLFSHYEYFDRLMGELLGSGWVEHQRSAWVWLRGRYVPYPLQHNLWRLSEADFHHCLEGLRQAQALVDEHPPADFGEWILRHFGAGLAELFMVPYNTKVWGVPPSRLGVQWMAERVAPIDLDRVLRNARERTDDASWGPNATFRFPLEGGTGAIWSALAARLPASCVRPDAEVVVVDPGRRVVRLADGSEVPYDHLISTMPLDRLLRASGDGTALGAKADELIFSGAHVVGLGLPGQPPEHLRGKSWIYFPEPELPFYRVTVFSNYSPYNVPDPDRTWSLMCEVGAGRETAFSPQAVVDGVLEGCRAAELVPPGIEPVSRWHRHVPYAYPAPFVGRDELLRPVHEALHSLGIRSRGRFGAWKYEVGNQDHSLMQGVEAVDHLLSGADEATWEGRAG